METVLLDLRPGACLAPTNPGMCVETHPGGGRTGVPPCAATAGGRLPT